MIKDKYSLFTYLQNTKKSLIAILNYLVSHFYALCDYCKNDFDESILKLRKGVICYEYIDLWNIFNRKSLPLIENSVAR